MKTLRWGLLSTARINRSLIPPLRVSTRNQLVAVASRTQATADAYAREWGIPRAFGSYEALLADPEVDVVYISLPNHLHAEWTIKAARAGKHVLCEKPLAITLAEVDAMTEAARLAGVIVAEAFMYRSHPQTLRVKEWVDSGEIGSVQFLRGSFSFTLDKPNDVRWDPKMGGGGLWDVGCYPVSYIRMIVGAEPEKVVGWQTLSASGVDDFLIGQLQFPGALLAQFDCSFRAPFRTAIEIVGSEGYLRMATPFKPKANTLVEITHGDETRAIAIAGPDELYTGEVEDLADAILLGVPPRVSLEDSRANVATLLALLRSARDGLPVKMTDGE